MVPTQLKKVIDFPESLVSDIPAGDGKTDNPFLQCTFEFISEQFSSAVRDSSIPIQ
jgi:hypothetical protein